MPNISSICITNRIHPHFFEAINSVIDFADEIIVIDTGLSQDEKEKINKECPQIKILKLVKKFTFAEQVREEVKQYAKHEWVLYFDNDEILTDGLKKYINKNINNYDYFAIPRKNIIFDKWIKHSRWWPDYQLRLIKKDKVVWNEKIYIHVQPELEGEGKYIEPNEELAMLHYNYLNIDEYIQKAMYYAKQEAAQIVIQKKSFSLKIAINKSISEFVSRYFTHEGYKDGMHGFVLATLQMFYYFLVYFYVWEKNDYKSNEEKTVPNNTYYFFHHGFNEVSHWIVAQNVVNKKNKMRIKIRNKLLSLFG